MAKTTNCDVTDIALMKEAGCCGSNRKAEYLKVTYQISIRRMDGRDKEDLNLQMTVCEDAGTEVYNKCLDLIENGIPKKKKPAGKK